MEVGGDVTKVNNMSNPFQNTSKCFLKKLKNQVFCVALRNLKLPPWVTVGPILRNATNSKYVFYFKKNTALLSDRLYI